jgi:hypothetical protein
MSIDRRVIDPSVNTKVVNNPFTSFGKLAMIPYSAPMNDLNLAKTIENVKTINLARDQAVVSTRASAITGVIVSGFIAELQPLIIDFRQKALNEVDKQLVAAGLLDSIGGNVSSDAQRKYSFEIQSSLPTPGITVKGCRDECDICEPALKLERELGIERKKLENELLKRQIELLEKSQEYRCCPGESNPLLIKKIE